MAGRTLGCLAASIVQLPPLSIWCCYHSTRRRGRLGRLEVCVGYAAALVLDCRLVTCMRSAAAKASMIEILGQSFGREGRQPVGFSCSRSLGIGDGGGGSGGGSKCSGAMKPRTSSVSWGADAASGCSRAPVA